MPEYPTGPGRHHTHRSGAVIEAYAETDALSRECHPPKGCGAAVDDFCVFPDGSQRHIPCVARTHPGSSEERT